MRFSLSEREELKRENNTFTQHSQKDFTTRHHRTLVKADRLSIIYVNPLYFLHSKNTTIVVTS